MIAYMIPVAFHKDHTAMLGRAHASRICDFANLLTDIVSDPVTPGGFRLLGAYIQRKISRASPGLYKQSAFHLTPAYELTKA